MEEALGEIILKRGRWIVRFQGRQFKHISLSEAEGFLKKLNLEGLPDR